MSLLSFRQSFGAWRRLDNAAKIFPSTTNRRNTRVFRYSCELKDRINSQVLEAAAERTLEMFPSFRCVMSKGVFWYYLEDCELLPKVREDNRYICSKLYNSEKRQLLFEITYFKNRINLEVFHALSDGTGSLQFLKALVCVYIKKLHPECVIDDEELGFIASATEQNVDAFSKFYSPKNAKKQKKTKAFHIQGHKREAGNLLVTEGVCNTAEVLALAKKYNTSLTVLLTAIYIRSIYKQMSFLQREKPIVISVPVNLRRYFKSETARNFFGMIKVSYDFSKQDKTLESIIGAVKKTFDEELTRERLAVRMNSLAKVEHNFFARIAPLFFKNLVLSQARKIEEKGETAVISNVGRVDMPKGITPYIERFSVYTSTMKLQLCLCSFEDKLSLCFTSNFSETEIQRAFFKVLCDNGINVKIYSNDYFIEEED